MPKTRFDDDYHKRLRAKVRKHRAKHRAKLAIREQLRASAHSRKHRGRATQWRLYERTEPLGDVGDVLMLRDGEQVAEACRQVGLRVPETAYGTKAATKYLGISEPTVRREYQAGRLNYHRAGTKYLFTQHDLERWRQQQSGNLFACSNQRENEVLRLCQT